MPRHTRAVILLGGWLLMQPYALPPHTTGRPKADSWAIQSPDAPVKEWEHVASFDTAAECERARARLAQEAETKWRKKATASDGDSHGVASVMWGQAASALCVPAEHIYPPQ